MSSTPYGISRSIGSVTYNGYVNAPITGPLSTNQYPSTIPYHNYGTLTGQRPTPPQFFPSQEPIYAEMNTNARKQYLRATSISSAEKAKQDFLGKLSPVITNVNYSTQRQIPVSTHVNYIAPIQSSMYLNIKKSIAIGKSAYKVGLPLASPISTKNYYPSGTRTALQRARSSGCTAPKKKGSIYNYSLTEPGICAWGALPRQTYS
jgi:hypothetical protein